MVLPCEDPWPKNERKNSMQAFCEHKKKLEIKIKFFCIEGIGRTLWKGKVWLEDEIGRVVELAYVIERFAPSPRTISS